MPEEEVTLRGYPRAWKDGNSFADAACKLAVAEHDVPDTVDDLVWRTKALSQMFAKYLARIAVKALSDGRHKSDIDEIKRDDAQQDDDASAAAEKSNLLAVSRHIPVDCGTVVRCRWCLRCASDGEALDRVPCGKAEGHTVWITESFLICAICGAYSKTAPDC